MYRRRCRGLEGEPFLQTGAAKGVKAIEEGERLVEEVGTDLSKAELAGASSSQQRARKNLGKCDPLSRNLSVSHVSGYRAHIFAPSLSLRIPSAAFLPHRPLSPAPQHHETWTSTYRARQLLLQIALYSARALDLGHGSSQHTFLSVDVLGP